MEIIHAAYSNDPADLPHTDGSMCSFLKSAKFRATIQMIRVALSSEQKNRFMDLRQACRKEGFITFGINLLTSKITKIYHSEHDPSQSEDIVIEYVASTLHYRESILANYFYIDFLSII